MIGKGHNDAFMVHDFELLEWIGANSFRTSHYPYSEEVLDYADRHGIVRHRRDRRGRAQHGSRRRHLRRRRATPTFSPDTINDTTREVHAQAIRELVARDKNHPSVVLWSIANEPESRHRGRGELLPAAVRPDPRARPDPAGRLRQRHARPVRQVPGVAVRRRADAQPLLRLVHPHRRPGRRRAGLGAGAARLGRARASRSSSPSTAPTPIPACTRSPPSRGPRSTRSTTST